MDTVAVAEYLQQGGYECVCARSAHKFLGHTSLKAMDALQTGVGKDYRGRIAILH